MYVFFSSSNASNKKVRCGRRFNVAVSIKVIALSVKALALVSEATPFVLAPAVAHPVSPIMNVIGL